MRPPVREQTRWPTVEELERMGLTRCQHQPCSVFVDGANVPSGKCLNHQRTQRQARPIDRPLAELRFAPLPDVRERKHRRDRDRQRQTA